MIVIAVVLLALPFALGVHNSRQRQPPRDRRWNVRPHE